MKISTLIVPALFLAALLAADEAKKPGPPLANDHVVQDGLLGTWRQIDPETQAFVPFDFSDLLFKANALFMGEMKMLPHEEDCFFYASNGRIGENTDLFYLPLWFFALEGDLLVIADQPSPTAATEGAALFKKIK